MKYLYTVFHERDGYAWEENTPESFTEITPLLSQCENISHQILYFSQRKCTENSESRKSQNQRKIMLCLYSRRFPE